MANSVYDPETEDEQRPHPPNLDPLDNRPAGNSSDPRTLHNNRANSETDSRSNLRDAENDSGSGFYNPGGDQSQTTAGGSATASSLGAAENSGAGDTTGTAGGFNFNPKDKAGGGFNNALKLAAKHKKGIGIGVGVGGGLAGIALMAFFLLIPLKIEHIVNNLENRFFATSEDAVGKETDHLLKGYITKVLPSYRNCGSTISKDCKASITGNGPVNNLYRTWADARLENKLATNYGVEFKYDKYSRSWFLKAPGSNPGGDNIGSNGQGLDSDFQRADRSTMRNAIRDAMQNETKWKKVMYRYKVGRLLEAKYGIKRCIIFCGTRDALADKKNDKKIAAQLYLVQRVIGPRNQSLSIVMQCLLDPNCIPEDTQPTPTADQEGAAVEQENKNTDTAVRTTLVQMASTFGLDDADKLIAQYHEISDKGFQKYVVEQIFKKIGLGAIASQAADAIPIVNIITSASTIITLANNAGPAITKLGYITNSSAAAQTYMMYRTYGDEVHTGHTDPTELGSMVDSLGPGNHGPASDPEKGGTASAENTPLYQEIIDKKSPSAAQSANSKDYICNNGKPVPQGQPVCNEEVLAQSNPQLSSSHDFLNQPGISVITSMAQGVAGFTGTIGNFFGNIITSIPGVGGLVKDAASLVGKVLGPFFEKVATILIPSPFGSNMSGGRTFDMMAAGADVSGNSYAQNGLGGKELTPAQTAAIVNEHQNQADQSFARQSVFARMFNTDSENSLVSKVAMGVPFGTQAMTQSGMASLLNPFGALSHNFGSILSGKANAAMTAQPDPFGVTQYGYPDGTIPTDPEAYWNAHCSDKSEQSYQNDHDFQHTGGGKGWVGTAQNSPISGMPVNKTTNPCLLIKATVGSAGGLFDTSLLTKFDKADQQSNAAASPSTTTTASADIDMGKLYDSSVDVACADGTTDEGIQDGYTEGHKVKIRLCAIPGTSSTGGESNGDYGISSAGGKIIVNSRISGAILAMVQAAKQAGITPSASSSFRTMAHQQCLYDHTCGSNTAAQPGYSNHQMGLAIDWDSGMYTWLAQGNGAKFGFKALVSGEPWHWSPTGN